MNWWALLSQEYLSANVRHAAREIRSASMQATRRSSFNTPTGLPPMTSFGPVTGKAATGTPQAIAQACLALSAQHPSAWTHEMDLRPFSERF